MAFSASTCLSNTNGLTLGPTLTVYSNPISATNPGTTLYTASTSSVIGGACPYTFVVPNNTQTIRLYDPITNCYVDIPVSSNDVCVTCNLKFSSLSNNQASTIYVGNLTGSCDTVIENYKIGWYGPNDSSKLSFTSGKGDMSTYDYVHPITPTSPSSPFLLVGDYVSKILEVELNGVKFSYTGGTNNVLSPNLINCTTGATVVSYNCGNGDDINLPYKHTKSYTTDGSSPPQSLSAQFELSANTEYFIWHFFGFEYYDTLTLVFSGDSYSVPITLENLRQGGTAFTNLLPTQFPKAVGGSNFKKITTLTGLTVNEGDSIFINVTPNPTITATTWQYRFGCSSRPTAEKNCLDSYKNRPYKIKKDSITGVTNACNSVTISFDVSGCSVSENSGWTNSNLAALTNDIRNGSLSTNNTTKLLRRTSYDLTLGSYSIKSENLDAPGANASCMNSLGNTISISKTISGFTFSFSNINDLLGYYKSFTASTSHIKSQNYGSGQFVDDNTNLNYYRLVRLYYYTDTGNRLCDNLPNLGNFAIHCNATCTTGTTMTGYTMFIDTNTPPFVNNYTCPYDCTINCPGYLQSFVNSFNATRAATFSTITNTSGLRIVTPFYRSQWLYLQAPTAILNNQVAGEIFVYNQYSTNTYASSGLTNILIPSLSGTSWDWENHFTTAGNIYNPFWYQIVYYYRMEITSTIGMPLTFKLYGARISNFSWLSGWIPIYDSTDPDEYDRDFIY